VTVHKKSSQGTFSDGLYVTPLVTVGFRHKILFMTLYVLYMTISFCHENHFFSENENIEMLEAGVNLITTNYLFISLFL
jgi:hypothetical protein